VSSCGWFRANRGCAHVPDRRAAKRYRATQGPKHARDAAQYHAHPINVLVMHRRCQRGHIRRRFQKSQELTWVGVTFLVKKSTNPSYFQPRTLTTTFDSNSNPSIPSQPRTLGVATQHQLGDLKVRARGCPTPPKGRPDLGHHSAAPRGIAVALRSVEQSRQKP